MDSRTSVGAGVTPVIDGNIDDLIAFATSLGQGCLDTESLTPDLRPKPGDVCKTNALLIPCTAPQVACEGGGGTYFLNGFDLTRAVVTYDRAAQTLYLGQRLAGIVGDSDGDGTANAGVGCTPPLNPGQQRIQDGAGIGFQESYTWGLDTNCDGKSDILIRTQTGTGGTVGIEVLGAPAGATQGAFNGSDIEARVQGIDLPFVFAMTAFSGSTSDGLSEDASNSVRCGPPNVDLEITKLADPTTICPDGTTTFTITVQNTGEAPLTTTLTDQLPADLTFDNNVTGDFTVDTVVGGLITFDPLVIPPGATRTVSFRALAGPNCFGVVTNTATATGTFTEPCLETLGKGPLSVSRSATADVTCKDRPCVTLVVNPIAPQCEGTPVTITGSATNCSRDPETITVSVVGGGSQNLGVVAAGASANFSIPAGNLLCKTGSETFTVNAVADGDCEPNGTDTETVTVDCLDQPCVTMTVNPLAPQCEGTPVTITGSVTNCSDDPETIVVQLAGGGSQDLGSVASGATVNFSIPAGNLACVDGSRTFSLTATASNACPPAATDTETVTITCLAPPCVTMLVNPLAPQCEGTPVTITGSVTNCSPAAETIVVQLAGGGSQDLGSVASGATVNFSIPAGNLVCDGGSRTYSLTATATGACPPVATDTETVTIDCVDTPCVELTVNPLAPQCEGTPVTITGSVRNCSDDPEGIVVQLAGGGSQDLGIVAAGATANFSIPAGNLDCVEGNTRTYSLTASASGGCPPAGTDTETVTITCLAPPCVTMTVNPLAPQCEGTPVTITGSVTNCSPAAETIVVQLAGGGSQDLGSVAAGATVNFSIPAGNLVCDGGSHTYSLTATATGACPPVATDTETVTIDCVDTPCVELTVNPLAPQCEGTPVTITGSVRNCSDDPEGIVVQLVGGGSQDLGTVAAGATANFSIPAGNLDCVEGNTRIYSLTATATGACPPAATDTETVTITCVAPPCVTMTVNPLAPQCEGTPVTITGSVTNCSPAAETIVVQLAGGGSQNLGSVASGATVNFSIPAGNLDCVEGNTRIYSLTATATGACEPAATDTKTVTITCLTPQIQVAKSGPATVNNGETISYTITVTNPSATVDLEDVVVVDELCTYVKDPRNFAGSCTAGAPDINGRILTWPAFNLARGASCTITFDVTADVASGGATCPTRVNCLNVVRVSGACAGSGGQSRVEATAEWPTEIVCAALNCPRTVGFWNAQCAQRGNGSTKFNAAQLTSIAERVDETSSFFNWSAGTDMSRFCAIIDPSKPMDQRKQAKRQFAGMLANYAVTLLGLTPSNGAPLVLDPSTPVSCAGLEADTIGELIVEVDQLLTELEGQSLSDNAVKAKYTAIISCTDAINNGVSIPTRPDCEHGGATPSGSSEAEDGSDAGSGESETASSVALLNRAVPNPFTATMSYSFQIPDGSAQSVEVGVYDVAGRLVSRLASGARDAGVHTVQWDGRSDDRARVAAGVYFVRARIGATAAVVTRVIYMQQ